MGVIHSLLRLFLGILSFAAVIENEVFSFFFLIVLLTLVYATDARGRNAEQFSVLL